jgi:nucleotide-binding universal stress UspA family protein
MPRIFHPTDLSKGSETAFLLSLKLSLSSHGVLTVMHVTDDDERDRSDLPGVRSTLARWGLIANEDDRPGFEALHMGVRKVIRAGDDPVKTCLRHLKDHPTDLIVLSTAQGEGLLKRRTAEPISRGAGEPSLFVPHHFRGIIDPDNGEVRMRRILVPVDHRPDPRRAMEAACKLAELLGQEDVHITLMHVGDGPAPRMALPLHKGWTFDQLERNGEVVATIVQAVQELAADVVVMATQGHNGFLDALRGSTTERVLRHVPCPVLAVPA